MALKLLLVVNNPSVGAEYRRVIEKIGVELEVAGSIAEVTGCLARTPISGILIDVPTLVRASNTEKVLIHDIIQTFPTARLRWDTKARVVRTLLFGQPDNGDASLAHFILDQCAPFQERTIRINDRVDANVCLILSRSRELLPEASVRTVTMNISRGGCFIFTTAEWKELENGWISFQGIKSEMSIPVEVRWIKEWGASLGVPGIGVKFLEIDKEVLEELGRRIGANLER